MAHRILELNFQIRYNELGADGKLRTQTFFDYMQESAASHAEILGVGLSAFQERNLLWVLSRIRFRMEKAPELGDSVLVRTYPSGFRRLFATRQFELTSRNTGELLAVASSDWLVLNASNLRPQNPVAVIDPGLLPDNTDQTVYFSELEKLPHQDVSDSFNVTIRQSHIDVNRHLNNSYYAAFTQDWVSNAVGSFTRIQEIQINFNQTMPPGAVLTCAGLLNGNTFVVEGHDDSGRNAFQAKGMFVIPKNVFKRDEKS